MWVLVELIAVIRASTDAGAVNRVLERAGSSSEQAKSPDSLLACTMPTSGNTHCIPLVKQGCTMFTQS